jgi:hypothetical protein
MDYWSMAIYIYIAIAVYTLMPTIFNFIDKVLFDPGSSSFNESDYFSEVTKKS